MTKAEKTRKSRNTVASETSKSGKDTFEAAGERTSKQRDEVPPIAHAVAQLLRSTRTISRTGQLVLPHAAKWVLSEVDRIEKKLKKYVPNFTAKTKGSFKIELNSEREFAEFTEALRGIDELHAARAPQVLAQSLFIQLFSEFDAYTGLLLKTIYLKNDDLLKGITREIGLADLLTYQDLTAVKRAMLDKEIESLRRESYVEQFAALERKFGLPLRKFPEWPAFIELAQRRNIFTHNGGVVTDQYLLVCDREGYVFRERPKIGDSLKVPPKYFSQALRLVGQVGLMLGYTLWSKVFPTETERRHAALNETIYGLLQQKRWRLVAELTDFVLSESMRRGAKEVDLRVRIVNVAIGLKFAEYPERAKQLLQSVDWSASYRDFKLAIAVLEENYDEAVKLMEGIGKSGEMVSQSAYHTWPLFTRFRQRPEFFDAYARIYGEPFAERVETAKGSVEVVVPRSRPARVLALPFIPDVSDAEIIHVPANNGDRRGKRGSTAASRASKVSRRKRKRG